jgi:hypothetical protein
MHEYHSVAERRRGWHSAAVARFDDRCVCISSDDDGTFACVLCLRHHSDGVSASLCRCLAASFWLISLINSLPNIAYLSRCLFRLSLSLSALVCLPHALSFCLPTCPALVYICLFACLHIELPLCLPAYLHPLTLYSHARSCTLRLSLLSFSHSVRSAFELGAIRF